VGANVAVRPPPAQPQASAAQILLAAAERAERGSVETGKYWRVKSAIDRQYRVPAGYDVTSRVVEEPWNARDSGERGWFGSLGLGTSPSTPADEQAWRLDGSPTEWQIHGQRLTVKPQKPIWVQRIGPNTFLGENEVSLAELAKLPTDPTALQAWLRQRVWAQGGIYTEAVLQSQIFATLVQLLGETPASPPVRAAALRVLAAMPNVHNAGTGTDAMGRSGIRIVFDSGNEHGEMIIDLGGPTVLAIKRQLDTAGQPKMLPYELDTLIISAAWTNDTPVPPTAP